MLKIEDMLETRMVKDVTDERGYSEGYYNNRVPVYGYYLKAKKGSLLEGLEIYSKSKFKLEKDPENYAQEARLETWLALKDYYENVGNKNDSEEDVSAWVYKVVTNKLKDLSRKLKSSVSYYDWEKGEYIINDILYLDKTREDDSEKYLDIIMEIDNIKNSKKSESEFKIWLNNNKDRILTNRQIGYLDGSIMINNKNESKIKNNIIKRIDNNFHENYIIENKIIKLNNMLDEIKRVSELLSESEISNELMKLDVEGKCYVIDDMLYQNLQFEDCKNLTNVLNGEKVEDVQFFNRILEILIKKENYLLEKLKKYDFRSYI